MRTARTPPPAPRRVTCRALPLLLAVGCMFPARATDPAPETPAAPKQSASRATVAQPADANDLGRGLRYLHLGNIPAEAGAAAAAIEAPALVLDLRLASETADNASLLRALLASRSASRPLFVLLGSATPAALSGRLSAAPGVLTLAPASAGFPAGLTLVVDPAQDRAAAEALLAGRPARELVEEKIVKTRYDEAHLASNHANGRRDTAEPTTSASPLNTDAAPSAEGADETDAPPVRDLLLQRAVFLHRALLALGRIPDHT